MILILGALVLVNLYVFVWDKKTSVSAIKKKAEQAAPSMTLPSQPLSNSAPAEAPGDPSTPPIAPPGAIEGKVGKNETLGKLLKKHGLSAGEADEVIRSLSGVLDFKSIRPGQPFRIERGPDGRVKLFEIELSKVQRVRAERQQSGELEGVNDNTQTKLEIKSIGGTIDSSLYAAIKNAGESASLVGFFVDVFAYDIDFFNDTQDGDTFRIIVEKKLAADGTSTFLGYGRILAAEYRGKAGAFQTYFWNGKYYDAKGESSERGMLKTPLKFVRVSSGFDRRRMHPVLHTVRAHLGIDYAAPVGTPVWAAASGTVVVRAPSGGAGNLVIIRHDSGIETAYMHLSKFANIKVGQRIEAKTVIGYVGTTGLSTGPHLHFGVRKNGEYIDPTKLAPIRGRGLPKGEIAAFKAEVAKLDGQMAAVAVAPVAPSPQAPPTPTQVAPSVVGSPTAAL
ncbi:MAG: M23 family metallopeptidase [Kofleriaceae bacterium]|nr:M23 family metallopeptidase [Kofleriaceae bacterium]